MALSWTEKTITFFSSRRNLKSHRSLYFGGVDLSHLLGCVLRAPPESSTRDFQFFLCNQPPILEGETYFYNQQCLALWTELSNGHYAVFSTPNGSIKLGHWQHVAFSFNEDGTARIYKGDEQPLTVCFL